MIVIGPAAFLPALQARIDDERAVFVSEAELHRVRELIAQRRPAIVTFERLFATTARGAALMRDLKEDASLSAIELRVMAHDQDYMRVVRPGVPPRTEIPQPARVAERSRIRENLIVQIDGKPVSLTDLSDGGAQVTSESVLRPNQVVRLAIITAERTLRFVSTIAWSSFEMSKQTGRPQYRAGLTFSEGDFNAIELVCRDFAS